MSLSIDSYEACQLRAGIDKGLNILHREAKLRLTAIATVIGSALPERVEYAPAKYATGSLIRCLVQRSSIIGPLAAWKVSKDSHVWLHVEDAHCLICRRILRIEMSSGSS